MEKQIFNFVEVHLCQLRAQNLELGEPNLVLSEKSAHDAGEHSDQRGLHEKFLELLSKPFLSSGLSLASLQHAPIDGIDRWFDRNKLRNTFKPLILNADKIEHLRIAEKAVKGSNPFLIATKVGMNALSRTAPYVERGLVREYVQLIAASYGLTQSPNNESVIRDSIIAKNSTLSYEYHESTCERTEALNKLARATNKYNIDRCLSRIDDFYRERLLLSHLEQ